MAGLTRNIPLTGYNTYGLDALLGTQSVALDALVKHFSDRQPAEVYYVNQNHIIGARWVDADGEEIVVAIDFYGRFTRVGYSILTESDKEDGITDAEWYDCTDLDGLWEELQQVLITAGLPAPRRRRGARKAA
jgi:hypothetical protein